ncbi:MAG TPA: DUF1659 domain-containing protein [Bacillota bacterium]|nr:DUF1659 domain-containing protein [Bacillota bacterium]
MAATDVIGSRLRLVYYVGDNPETGNPMFEYKNFNQVKTDATSEQLFNVATAVAELQDLPLFTIERHDTTEIYEED